MTLNIKENKVSYDFERIVTFCEGNNGEEFRSIISRAVAEDHMPDILLTIGKDIPRDKVIVLKSYEAQQVEKFIDLHLVEAKWFGPGEFDRFTGKTATFFYNSK